MKRRSIITLNASLKFECLREAQSQTREDLTASGGEQAVGASAVEGNEKAAEAAQDKKSGTRRRFWKGRAKRGGKQTDKKVAGEPADGGPAPAEDGTAASADNGTATSAGRRKIWKIKGE